jgi:hypothetical protein
MNFSLIIVPGLPCYFFRFPFHDAIMRAECRANAAVVANDRFLGFFVDFYRADRASRYAFAAAHAFFRVQQHAASGAFTQGSDRAGKKACGFVACPAYHRHKPAGHPPGRADPYRAFINRVAFVIGCRACNGAGLATEAFVNPYGIDHIMHKILQILEFIVENSVFFYLYYNCFL